MTCIVGIETSDGVLLGSDSAVSSGWSIEPTHARKVFAIGPHIGIGLCGSPRMGQLLQYKLEPPEPPMARSSISAVSRYMATDFVDAVRETLKAGGHAEKENEKERADSSFLVAIRGFLFAVYGDYQATYLSFGFGSVGSGYREAMGALAATRQAGLTPKARALAALEASAEFTSNVAPPFHFLEVPRLVGLSSP